MGYDGHLFSHGIRFQDQENTLGSLMNGFDDWRLLAADLGVRYLFWGERERARWPSSFQNWRRGSRLVASGPWGEIFDLHTPPLPLDDWTPPLQ
jgi:hypothetical protein